MTHHDMARELAVRTAHREASDLRTQLEALARAATPEQLRAAVQALGGGE